MGADTASVAKILLAEDCEDDAFMLSHALGKVGMGHVLARASDGQEAIEYLSEGPRPDLLVLDLKMPRLDGFDVLAFVRTRLGLKDLPVIVLTGSAQPNDQKIARELGVMDYLVKSLDWRAPAEAIKSRFQQIPPT